ncbi:hypothetical protein GC177_06810 [bacterium]|nr:hypothetical protein [bacterium]
MADLAIIMASQGEAELFPRVEALDNLDQLGVARVLARALQCMANDARLMAATDEAQAGYVAGEIAYYLRYSYDRRNISISLEGQATDAPRPVNTRMSMQAVYALSETYAGAIQGLIMKGDKESILAVSRALATISAQVAVAEGATVYSFGAEGYVDAVLQEAIRALENGAAR